MPSGTHEYIQDPRNDTILIYINGDIKKVELLSRIDTKNELEYYKNGGILQFVLRNMI